ncbi:TetR/AcrR family transcriptional regulator [Caulobacter sp. KR2-114]|uniref:TetR/AcrR family transcriptional regulator n=1 Tax=Caulobacter sp. KR2-114 TaxID=3400912 RepID=UPI003C0E7146
MDTVSAPTVDGRRLRGDRTRQTVLAHAVRIAGCEGLESLSFGRVALAAGVPKSTLQTLFKDRDGLQSQVLDAGAEAFAAGLRARLGGDGPALHRLRHLCAAWFDLVEACETPGGCLVTAAAAEFRCREGPLATKVAEHQARWRQAVTQAVAAARAEGALRADLDVDQLVFEILAFQGAANLVAGRAGALDLVHARRAVEALLTRAAAA